MAADHNKLDFVPNNIFNKIEMLKLTKDKDYMQVIGSYGYRNVLWASDVDCFELAEEQIDKISVFFTSRIREIVKDVETSPNVIFGELKCGVDDRYTINIGSCMNDKYTVSETFPSIVEEYYKDKLFDVDEYSNIKKLLNEPHNQLTYESIEEIIRNRYIIRWKYNEVLKGVKVLPGGITVSLGNCCLMKGNINIECVAILEDRYVDISNFFVLVGYDTDGNLTCINGSQDLIENLSRTMEGNLKEGAYILANSKLKYNPVKVAKRMYSLFRIDAYEEGMTEMYRILNGPIGFLYTLSSEMKLLSKVAKKYPIIPSVMALQLQSIKYRLGKLPSLSSADYADACTQINKLTEVQDRTLISNLLDLYIHKIFDYIYPITQKTLENLGILPITFIPDDKKPF